MKRFENIYLKIVEFVLKFYLPLGVVCYLLLAVILALKFVRVLGPNEFIFIHDEYLTLDKFHALRAFLVQNPINFGTSETTNLIVTFFSRCYYLVSYSVGMSIAGSQLLLFSIKLFFIGFLPFLGFKKIAQTLFNIDLGPCETLDLKACTKTLGNLIGVVLVALVYSFNTYTLIYWHGNSFELTLLLCYALAPLAFYYFHTALFKKQTILADFLKPVVILFFMSFAFYLCIVFVLFLMLYFLLIHFVYKTDGVSVLKRLGILSLLYIPFLPLFGLIPYEMLFSSVSGINTSGGETFNNLAGSLLYPLFMWYSWGIYTYWDHRNIFTFHDFFKHLPYLFSPILVYVLLLVSIFKNSYRKYLLIFLLIFLCFLFFIKGPQEPFGELFKALLEKVPVFRVFRSPDNKFGFALVLALCLSTLSIVDRVNKKLLLPVLIFMLLVQSHLLINSKAIIGENTDDSRDRIIRYTQKQEQLIQFLNSKSLAYENILPYPPDEFGNFTLEDGDYHIGQELISKRVAQPFIFYSKYSGVSTEVFSMLTDFLEEKDFEIVKQLPINYLLVRRDIAHVDYNNHFIERINRSFPLLFSNETYKLYDIGAPSILSSDNLIAFNAVSPIHYKLKIDTTSASTLTFMQSYNPKWKLYEITEAEYLACDNESCRHRQKPFLSELAVPFKESHFENSHKKSMLGMNEWDLDGTNQDVKYYSLYFSLQSYFYYSVLLAGVYLMFMLLIIATNRYSNRNAN